MYTALGRSHAAVLRRCPECAFGDIDMNAKGDGRWKVEWYAVPCNVADSSLRYDIVVSSYYWFSLVVSNTRCAAALFASLLPQLSHRPVQACALEMPLFSVCHALAFELRDRRYWHGVEESLDRGQMAKLCMCMHVTGCPSQQWR